MKKITSFVLAIIKKGNTYLLTKRAELDKEDPKSFHNAWQLPGGGVKFGETVEVAIKREIREELGVEIEPITIIPYIINSIRSNWHGIGIPILCKFQTEFPVIKLNREASEYGWFTLSQIKKLKTLPSVRKVIKAAERIY